EVRDSGKSQFADDSAAPEMLVKESVKHAVEKQAGGRVEPPGKREMQSGHQFGDGPGTQDRERCEEKRNESPFAGVWGVAVHGTTVRASELVDCAYHLECCWEASSETASSMGRVVSCRGNRVS